MTEKSLVEKCIEACAHCRPVEGSGMTINAPQALEGRYVHWVNGVAEDCLAAHLLNPIQ